MQNTNNTSPVLLEWSSPDSLHRERGRTWYLIGGVIVLMFAAYGLFQGSWTTSILALLIGGMYFYIRNEKPRMMNIRVTGMGITIAGTLFQWSNLKDFWILVGPDHQELHLVRQETLGREIVVYLHNIDPAIVRSTLMQYIPERAGMEERMLDSLARFLKL